ncbi:MAG TPA: phenylalanine--tRNA ligase subunit alpha [Gemmatimonadaceae bacterium]|nr:phenylalanine--tRNA ligase subunit alpha [Gemmatimonadaceae bacterium]
MTVEELLARADTVQAEGLALIAAASTRSELDAARTAVLGRKSGRLTALLAELPALAPDARRPAGAVVNRAKATLEAALAAREEELAATARVTQLPRDLTLPARERWQGAMHPVTRVIEEVSDIFRELGFTIALGPEAETEWYNFGSLNFPPDHPVMDLHDTLYLASGSAGEQGEMLLRTHTSPVQIRVMQQHAPPIRVLAPGNVYRHDPFDPSHAPMFAQIEGLAVDEGISFVDLKATLTRFAERFFGTGRTRFRPSYFPFTEPSAEMDVECGVCSGFGCPTCKQSGWVEILGSGMVHPDVFTAAGVDPERYTGWAFGMGPARIALARHGIPDIRLLYESDMRFLGQFR